MNENTVFTYQNSIGRITFSYNGAFGLTDIRSVSGVDVDVADARGMRQDGSTVTNQNVAPRTLTLNGYILEPLATHRKSLIDIIAPKVNSTLTVRENGESWFLNVVPTSTPDIAPGNGLQQFQCRLKAPYPYWRNSASFTTQLLGLTAMFKFPFYTGGNWWISKFSGDFFRTIHNPGNVPMPFDIFITARTQLTNPEVFHVGTGQKILIIKQMDPGERFIISTEYGQQGAVFVGADGVVSNGFPYLSYESDLSMALLPGDNLLRSDADSNREGLSVRISGQQGVKSGV